MGKEVTDFSFLRKRVEEVQGFKFGKLSVVLLILALIFIGLAVKFTFFYTEKCGDLECFQKNMADCDKASFVNELGEATWGYKILGFENGRCLVEATLLQVKEGQLNMGGLQGYGMVCEFDEGIVDYPEKDLDKCHGRLKEELQEIIIANLHEYMIENLEKIGVELKK